MKLKDCFKKGLLKRVPTNQEIIKKTIEMAINDLNESEKTHARGGYVWSFVQIYTSMLRERHLSLYDSRDHVTSEKVSERIDWCKEFYKRTLQLLENKENEHL